MYREDGTSTSAYNGNTPSVTVGLNIAAIPSSKEAGITAVVDTGVHTSNASKLRRGNCQDILLHVHVFVKMLAFKRIVFLHNVCSCVAWTRCIRLYLGYLYA